MRYAAMPFIFISLICAVFAGMVRVGVDFENIAGIAAFHGSLMTGSFLGSLISLERAIVVKSKLAYIVPLLSALSVVFFFIIPKVAFIILVMASVGLLVIMIVLYHRHAEWYQLIFIAGSAFWIIGNLSILVGDYYFFAAPWWMLFFLFVITAERLELARFILVKPMVIISCVVFLGLGFCAMLIPFHSSGKILLGLTFGALAILLLVNDLAFKNLKKSGVHRFSGMALILGYIWLLVSGIAMTFFDYSGLLYDAVLHSFFIGFVFSMVFAHGPIILPTVLKLGTSVFHPFLYVSLVILHIGLVIRVGADIMGDAAGRLLGSWIDLVAILLYFTVIAYALVRFKILKFRKLRSTH